MTMAQFQLMVRKIVRSLSLLGLLILPVACSPTPSPNVNKELILNGGFEKPVAPPGQYPVGSAPPANRSSGGDTHIINRISPGAEPPGFIWKVEHGDVDVVAYGYDSGGGNLFLGKMAEGNQHLDLDGSHAGTISQTIPTVDGGVYTLTFAYANNPDPDAGLRPFQALVSVVDAASSTELVAPVRLDHSGSTLTDYHWTRSGQITFTARSPATLIRFASQDSPSSVHGVLLDDISVKVVSEPLFFRNPFERYGLPAIALVAILMVVYLVSTSAKSGKPGQAKE